LRLDTDLYSSTYAEMTHLYPLISPGGILIIDDYGWLLGAQIATDQYIAEQKLPPFLTRINESVRLAVKPAGRPGRNRMTDARRVRASVTVRRRRQAQGRFARIA
jgi:hypothetical protein